MRRALEARRSSVKLAGEEGFEPPNGGIKTRCLTTWRHPSIRIAGFGGGRASYSRGSFTARPQAARTRASGRARAPRSSARDREPAPRGARLRSRSRTRRICTSPCPSAGRAPAPPATPTHPSLPDSPPPPQPLQRFRHFGIARPHHRLAVVAAAGLKKGAYCDEGGITCQFRALEHLPGTDRDTRVDDHVPTGWECLGAEALPHALRPGRETLNKNRDIRTEREAQSGELRHRESAAPHRKSTR